MDAAGAKLVKRVGTQSGYCTASMVCAGIPLLPGEKTRLTYPKLFQCV
jgi:aerobic-type carbon monoxide dehydrogenase small subunit (CoxS/CutS family)